MKSIGQNYLVNALMDERRQRKHDLYPQSWHDGFIHGLRRALSIVEQAPTNIVHCKDCLYWRLGGSPCPMCHDEWYDDDGYSDFYTVDQTPIDGSGFCHKGKRRTDDDEMY